MYQTCTSASKKHTSIEERMCPKRWERCLKAAQVGEAILAAKNTRAATQKLTAKQIATLTHACGVTTPKQQHMTVQPSEHFERGKLDEETLHAIARLLRQHEITFHKRRPGKRIALPTLVAFGVSPTPAHYQRNNIADLPITHAA